MCIQGGFNTNNTSTDYCAVRAAIPEQSVILTPFSPTNPFCNFNTGWITRFTALGSYTIPKIDVQIGGTIRSDKGALTCGELGGAQLGNRAVSRAEPVEQRADGDGQPD